MLSTPAPANPILITHSFTHVLQNWQPATAAVLVYAASHAFTAASVGKVVVLDLLGGASLSSELGLLAVGLIAGSLVYDNRCGRCHQSSAFGSVLELAKAHVAEMHRAWLARKGPGREPSTPLLHCNVWESNPGLFSRKMRTDPLNHLTMRIKGPILDVPHAILLDHVTSVTSILPRL